MTKAQGLSCGKMAKYLEELKLERNKKWVKRKLAEVECHQRIMEFYKGYNKRYGRV